VVVNVLQQALQVGILAAAPMLLAALAAGLIVSVFQAATQINEMTLPFVPKLLALFAAAVLAGPWMLGLMVDFTRRLFSSIPGLVG
jgi:flagellar biosynthetic protein FliQ